MLGVGLFINTTELASQAGILGALSYVTIGILLLPLILSIVKLLQLFPRGGFYIFGKETLGPFMGFLSAWSYFTGKLASAMLAIHIFVHLIQPLFPALAPINPLILDTVFLSLILGLNFFNVKIGSNIQVWLMVIKIAPIIFLILIGAFFLQGNHFGTPHQLWVGIPTTLPLVLHAMIGFEAACSLSSKIKDAHINAPKAVLISYGLVIGIYGLYQIIFYGVLGNTLATLPDYDAAFPAFFAQLPAIAKIQPLLGNIIHLAIATSALSGAFGMIYSNMWNLYTLAEHKHTFFPRTITWLNRHHIPIFCVLAEGVFCLLYLFVTKADQVTMQQIAALGCTVAYTMSVLALFVIHLKQKKQLLLPIFGLISCTILMSSCLMNLWQTSTASFNTFAIIMMLGTFMFLITKGFR